MKILHLEDNVLDAELVRISLQAEWPGCTIESAATRPGCIEALKRDSHELIISDFRLLDSFTGLEALELAGQYEPATPFIFFSGTLKEEVAVKAMRNGAADYILKDRPQRLIMAIRHALEKGEEQARRREAERRMREQSELLEKARDAIVVTDFHQHVSYWNQGAHCMLGWTEAEAMGKRLDTLLGIEAFVPETLAEADEWRGEVEAHDKQGVPVLLQTSMTVVRDEAGKPKARVYISSDVTENNRLREQFFRAQRLESLGMLAAGIAHDLNNVLAPMVIAPALLRERQRDPEEDRMLEMLEISAKRGSELVKQILGFAHGKAAGRQPLQMKYLLHDIIGFIQQTFPKSLRIEQNVPADLPLVIGSPTQVHQVLLNLCINARDAMPEGGTLSLLAEKSILGPGDAALIPGARPGVWLVLQVQDTGSGIPAELRAKIWEPFFTTKPSDKGSGLGLSTVRGIVDKHDGFVTMDSVVGQGTTFRIYLPVQPVDQLAA